MKAPEETDVGIACYISNLTGFRGILKQRSSETNWHTLMLCSVSSPFPFGIQKLAWSPESFRRSKWSEFAWPLLYNFWVSGIQSPGCRVSVEPFSFCWLLHMLVGTLCRYSDFIVNEVDLEGNVVHLTTLDAPPEVNYGWSLVLYVVFTFNCREGLKWCSFLQPVHVAEENETNASDQLNKSYDAEIESFRTLAGDSDADLLQSFIAQITSGAEESPSPIVLSPNSDKIHRTVCCLHFGGFFICFVLINYLVAWSG